MGQQRRQWLRGARIQMEIGRQARGKVVAGVAVWLLALAKAGDLNLAVLRDARLQLGRVDKGFAGREQRPLDIVLAVFVALHDALPRALQGGRQVDVGAQHHARRQIFKQADGCIEEQRQVELDAGGREALGHTAIDRHARDVATEAAAKALAKIAYRIDIQRNLARRQQAQLLHGCQRTL